MIQGEYSTPFPEVVWMIHPSQVEMAKRVLGVDELPPQVKVYEQIPLAVPQEAPSRYLPSKGAQWKRERAGRRP